ncbi:integrase, partial [Klebsiella pneumoniae]
MIALMPFILQVKNRQLTPEALCLQLNALNTNRMLERAARAFPLSMPLSIPPEKQIEQKKGLHLGEAWAQYKHERGKGWTAAIHSANERYMEVLLTILGDDRDVATITKRDIKQVMEVVEGLPKRVIQPYRSMDIKQLIACDVPEEHLIGTEAIHKHLKIYKSLFKTFLVEEKDVLTASPTDGVIAPPSSARYGAYTNSEMKSFVSYAIEEAKPEWLKWIILLLAYTGARRGEIATLTKSQVRYDDDSNRHYLLITDGKTENAAREVPLHNHLIDLGFLDFAASKKTELFSEVAGTNMAKIGKVMSDIREELNIPYRDIHNQRRIVHSFRHSVVTAA